ncbi:MAG: hypothetical protein HYZ75_04635 [Elusimicrobia bacterium]|nr:hypothetical protein [Elusimicrobiota bacterium]
MEPRLILVSSDKVLSEAFGKACAAAGARVDIMASVSQFPAAWGDGEARAAGVVADHLAMRDRERRRLLELHVQTGAPPLILLELPETSTVAARGAPVRLLWPPDEGFLEELRESGQTSLLVLVEPSLAEAGILPAKLERAGFKPFEAASPQEAISFAARFLEPGAALAALTPDPLEAEAILELARQARPDIRLLVAESRAPLHAAESALRRRRPALVPRRLLAAVPDLLMGREAADPLSLGRILLFEPDRVQLARLSEALLDEGFEVAACRTAEDAARRTVEDRCHVAVVAGSAESPEAAARAAAKLRLIDPELRLVLTVRRGSLQSALQGLAAVVEVGLDDCLLAPVDPDRLAFSVRKALERRFLQRENARLLVELQRTNHELESLTGFQKNFFAMVAHDVKNPLGAILGYAQLMALKSKDATLNRPIAAIESAAKTLNGLISDLVDFAAIESGKLRVSLEEMDLARVVTEVQSRVHVAAERRRITLSLALPPKLPILKGDPLRVGQVIQNLCTNAIQYTPEGGAVFLAVALSADKVTISVRDTGIGISKEDLPRIFERFFQAENAQVMRRAGFGLGLKISQEIVKAHEGTIGVSSELGKGSTFAFTLPLAAAAPT